MQTISFFDRQQSIMIKVDPKARELKIDSIKINKGDPFDFKLKVSFIKPSLEYGNTIIFKEQVDLIIPISETLPVPEYVTHVYFKLEEVRPLKLDFNFELRYFIPG